MGRFFLDFQIAGFPDRQIFSGAFSRFPPLSLFVPHKGYRLQSGLGILLELVSL